VFSWVAFGADSIPFRAFVESGLEVNGSQQRGASSSEGRWLCLSIHFSSTNAVSQHSAAVSTTSHSGSEWAVLSFSLASLNRDE
jgi:hypothetical protein